MSGGGGIPSAPPLVIRELLRKATPVTARFIWQSQ